MTIVGISRSNTLACLCYAAFRRPLCKLCLPLQMCEKSLGIHILPIDTCVKKV